MRLASTNANKDQPSDRIPAIFFEDDTQQLKFHIGLEREDDLAYKHPNKVSDDTWHNITVSQVFEKGEFFVRVNLDGSVIYDQELKFWPTTFDDVKVYLGDGFFPPLLGWVDQLNITTGNPFF